MKVCPVTVLYPVAAPKYVMWQNVHTGEVSSPRKSSRSATVYDMLAEMVHLLPFLKEPYLSFRAVTLQVTDVRIRTASGRRGERLDRLPQVLLEDRIFRCAADYAELVPPSLPPLFTTAEFAAAVKLPAAKASACLKVLRQLDVILQEGKRGRAFLYRINPNL